MSVENVSGIGFGLGAAACQTASYFCSRHFVKRTGDSPVLLLIVSHLLMGFGALGLLLVLRPTHLPPPGVFALPLAGAAGCYLVAQWGLFKVLRHVESSRVAPLLGMKIVVLAVLAVSLSHQRLHPLQWAAVLLSAAAAWLLNEAGGRLPLRSAVLLGMTILCYCLSDLSIGRLVASLEPARPSPAFIGAALSYLVCMLAVIPLSFRAELRQPRLWALAAPYAAAWFGAMCLLYACFALIGVVFGNIVQSTRGLMAVIAGWAVAHAGHTHLETRADRRTVWRRIAGAVLMMAAVALYMLGK